MGGAASEVETLEVGGAVGWLEGSVEDAVRGDAVDGSVQDTIAVVDVLRGEVGFVDDAVLDVVEAGGTLELVQE